MTMMDHMTEKIPNAQRLAQIGEVLYGKRWQRQLAEALGKDEAQIRRWIKGQSVLDDTVIEQAEDIGHARRAEIDAVLGKPKRKAKSTDQN